MPAVTGTEICRDALTILGVVSPFQAMSDSNGTLALRFLNDWLSEQSQKRLMIPVVARERFDLVSGQGGPDDPYTIGDGGDFDTIRPANQNSVTMANLILGGTDPEVRVPLGIYTDDAYDANKLPGMESGQPTSLYYDPTYEDELGSISLWPVPNVNTNDLELFIERPLTEWSALSTSLDVPPGVPRMLKYNLAVTLQEVYGRTLSASALQIATSSLRTFRSANMKLTDLQNDANFSSWVRTVFNINTGQ